MTPVDSWARRAATLPAVFVESTPDAVTAGAEVLEVRARANLLRASGGDLRLSRARSVRAARSGGRGQRVDVKVAVIGAGRRAEARVLPVGPVSLVEKDTRRHRIPYVYSTASGSGGKRRYATRGERLADGSGVSTRKRAQRVGFLYIPGIGFRTRVDHPGTKGKRPIGRAMDSSADEAGRAGLEVFAAAVRSHMRGA